ncbi:MAG: RNase adapter RapZ [Actinomycetota bacterium]|nr:RNase adapter RapZ [Actinomycetota bacterium]
MEVLIVTGMSGAGKTEALKCLEDLGYYAIDNLPAPLLEKIAELSSALGRKFERVALVMDVRGGRSFEELFSELELLRSKTIPYRIVFLDASDEVLVRRFSETRRMHPLESPGKRVVEAIAEERELLSELREVADIFIDTSNLNIHQLADVIRKEIQLSEKKQMMKVTIVSFGYKYGIPLDADIILDARFLPNPYWVEELRELDGLDERVRKFVIEKKDSQEFLEKFVDLITFLIPRYEEERKTYLTIGIGCTGGKHRSVALAEEIRRILSNNKLITQVIHRDIEGK